MATATKGKSRLVPVDSFIVARRGRTATIDPKVMEALKILPADGSVGMVLDEEFGKVAKGSPQSKVRAQIQAHWKALHGDKASVSVRWTPGETGLAQVRAVPVTQ